MNGLLGPFDSFSNSSLFIHLHQALIQVHIVSSHYHSTTVLTPVFCRMGVKQQIPAFL